MHWNPVLKLESMQHQHLLLAFALAKSSVSAVEELRLLGARDDPD
jgi:hypothetical protein